MRTKLSWAVGVLALAVFGVPHSLGGTIAQVSGPVTSNAAVASPDPFGGYDYAAASWTQTTTYHGITISFLGDAVFSTASGVAYLTTTFGAGTTIQDQIASAPFTVPFGSSSTDVMLFSGLNLGPGTYYLTLAANQGDQIGWNVTDMPSITTGVGVSVNSGMGCFNGSSPAPYPPGTTGSCVMDNLLYTVSGSSSGVPEPATFELLCIGALGLALVKYRRRQLP